MSGPSKGDREDSGEAEGGTIPDAGLCAGCGWGRVVRSRTSAFLRCSLSDRDPAFARYPTLPVVTCPGFLPSEPSSPETG